MRGTFFRSKRPGCHCWSANNAAVQVTDEVQYLVFDKILGFKKRYCIMDGYTLESQGKVTLFDLPFPNPCYPASWVTRATWLVPHCWWVSFINSSRPSSSHPASCWATKVALEVEGNCIKGMAKKRQRKSHFVWKIKTRSITYVCSDTGFVAPLEKSLWCISGSTLLKAHLLLDINTVTWTWNNLPLLLSSAAALVFLFPEWKRKVGITVLKKRMELAKVKNS